MENLTQPWQSLILFDGVCHLCNGFVRFVLERDPAGQFAFAPLQSTLAQQRLGGVHLESIVLLEGEETLYAERAVVRILARLQRPWPLLAWIAHCLPGWLLAWAYRYVARRRYRIFGRDATCSLPEPRWKGRFLG